MLLLLRSQLAKKFSHFYPTHTKVAVQGHSCHSQVAEFFREFFFFSALNFFRLLFPCFFALLYFTLLHYHTYVIWRYAIFSIPNVSFCCERQSNSNSRIHEEQHFNSILFSYVQILQHLLLRAFLIFYWRREYIFFQKLLLLFLIHFFFISLIFMDLKRPKGWKTIRNFKLFYCGIS